MLQLTELLLLLQDLSNILQDHTPLPSNPTPLPIRPYFTSYKNLLHFIHDPTPTGTRSYSDFLSSFCRA